MNWSIDTWPLVTWIWLAEAAAFLALFQWSWRRKVPGAGGFRGLALGGAIYVGFEAIGLTVGDPTIRAWLSGFSFAGIGLVSPSLLLLFSDFTGLNNWLTPGRRIALVVGGVGFAALRLLDPWLHLMYRSEAVIRDGNLFVSQYEPGAAHWTLIVMIVGSMAFGVVAVSVAWREASPLMRRHLLALVISCLFPVVTSAMFSAGVRPWGWLETTPFALIQTIGLTTWAIFHHRLVEVAPIARSYLVENFSEGMLAADRTRALIDINPAARKMLGLTDSAIFGRPLSAVLRDWPALTGLCASDTAAQVELRPNLGDDIFWEASWKPFAILNEGHHQGFLLVIADISARKKIEYQLHDLLAERTGKWRHATTSALRVAEEEQGRIGRVLHDTLCQDLVRLSHTVGLQVAEQEKNPASGAPKTALLALAGEIDEVCRRTRALSFFWEGPDLIRHSFPEALALYVSDLGTMLGVSCELAIAPGFPSFSHDRSRHVIRVVREAVVNGARHGRARKIIVALNHRRDDATITISNDGVPIPANNLLAEGTGLRQMRLRVELLGGTIAWRPGTAGGTVVELSLPVQGPDIAPGFFHL